MADLITLTIDGKEVSVPQGSTIIQACKELDVEIPHFCYHERLSVAGNCRMCLVEVEGGPPKPIASCAWPVMEGMIVHTKSEMAKEARKGTMEFLLINHPLDCPICDQGGECDLQDMAYAYGSDRTRFTETKRAVEDIDIGPLIKTVMTRCIHCTRCIRFATEVAGVEEFGITGRGEQSSVGTYVEQALESELCGNMIDLCPVGALTNKPYAFTARPWELERTVSIDVMDAVGSHIMIDHRAGEIMRIVPQECDDINEEWIADTARFSYDGLHNKRLSVPMVRKSGKLEATSWPNVFEAIKKKLKNAKSTGIAGLSGHLHCAEDLFSFNSFMKKTLGTDHVDGRGKGVTTDGDTRCAYVMNTPIADVEDADAVLLIGCDPRFEAPLVNTRIRKAWRQRNIPVASVGTPVDLTYPCTDLGNSIKALEALLDGTSAFTKALKKSKNPIMMIGAKSVLTRKDAAHILHLCRKIAEKYDIYRLNWNGFNVVHQHVGPIAALDMGVFPEKKGMTTEKTLKALKEGKVDVLVIYGESDLQPSDLKGAKFTIFIGTHESPYVNVADVILPAAAYTEKSGWWVNVEGRVQESRQAVKPPLHAKEDWKIFRALSEELGKTLPFDTQAQLRKLITEQGGEAYEEIGVLPKVHWKDFGAAGKILSEPFAVPVPSFYLNNEVLRASAVMRDCQELVDSRRQKNDMKKAG